MDLDDLAATYAEVGGVPVYFRLDLGTQQGKLPAGFKIPLNHYSIPENHVSVVLHFNQPVVATAANINSSLLSLEFFNGVAWTPIPTQVQLRRLPHRSAQSTMKWLSDCCGTSAI